MHIYNIYILSIYAYISTSLSCSNKLKNFNFLNNKNLTKLDNTK